jgi:hypothetical protein
VRNTLIVLHPLAIPCVFSMQFDKWGRIGYTHGSETKSLPGEASGGHIDRIGVEETSMRIRQKELRRMRKREETRQQAEVKAAKAAKAVPASSGSRSRHRKTAPPASGA